jgi:hypothetical protein
MSGPKRELPPLVIKILGDNSAYRKTLQDTVAASRNLAANLNAQAARGSMAGARTAMRNCTKAVQAAIVQYIQRITNGIGNISTGQGQITSTMRYAVRMVNEYLRNYIANMLNGIGNISTGQGQITRTMRYAVRMVNEYLRDYIAQMVNGIANIQVNARSINAAIRRALRSVNQFIAVYVNQLAQQIAAVTVPGRSTVAAMRRVMRSIQRFLVAYLNQLATAMQNVQVNTTALNTAIRRIVRQTLTTLAAIISQAMVTGIGNLSPAQLARIFGNALRRGARGGHNPPGGGGMGGGMMGARADIFMHQATLQSMGDGLLSLIKPFAQVENYTVQMEAFAGSAEDAKNAVAELQEYAIKSPYSLEGVLGASTTMMKYGAETKHAIEMTKLLGDVAAGNTNKLELMSLAVGQAEALGRLQGQELRQMVNAGFNPLSVAAKELAGPGADKKAIQAQMKLLQENMRAGALDSGIIEAALKIATSKGGDFAGLTEKQANTLTGLASQIIETLDLVSIEIVKVFAGDLNKLMKEVKRYLDAVVAWAKANKDLVASYVKLGMQILETVAFFSVLALTIAYVTWIWGTLRGVAMVFMFLLTPLARGVMVLGQAFLYLGRTGIVAAIQAAIAWLVALGPIWGTAAAIAAVIAAFAALWVLVEGFTSKRGFVGIFEDGTKAAWRFTGFMWNFGENVVNIFKFIGENWKHLVYDMLITNNPNIELARMGAKVFGMGDQFESMVGSRSAYDTSMFKFDMPGIDTKTVLGSLDAMLGVSDALSPYLKPLDGPGAIAAKPNIDFNQFLGKGGKGNGGSIKPIDHAIRGSADHAYRMYEYGERAKPAATDPKQQHQAKVETLLGEIAKNTKPLVTPTGNAPLDVVGFAW